MTVDSVECRSTIGPLMWRRVHASELLITSRRPLFDNRSRSGCVRARIAAQGCSCCLPFGLPIKPIRTTQLEFGTPQRQICPSLPTSSLRRWRGVMAGGEEEGAKGQHHRRHYRIVACTLFDEALAVLSLLWVWMNNDFFLIVGKWEGH